jgi:ADP-glucose pyrophosphorylase
MIDKGFTIPENAVFGHNLEQDCRRGFVLSANGVVIIAKDHGTGRLLSRVQNLRRGRGVTAP